MRITLIIARIAISIITNITNINGTDPLSDTFTTDNFSILAPFLVIMLIICGGAIYTAGRSIYINNLPENNVNEIPSQVIFNHSNDTSNLNKNNFKNEKLNKSI